MRDPDLDWMEETPDIDFSAEIVGDLHLQDYPGTIPDDKHLDYFDTMDPIVREELFPIIIRALFCARANLWLSRFFSELIIREAMTLKSLEDFIYALENQPQHINAAEMDLFTRARDRVQKAHSERPVLTTKNVTNAVVGYSSDVDEPRDTYIKDWLLEVQVNSECNVDMPDELRSRFNALPLNRIMGTN